GNPGLKHFSSMGGMRRFVAILRLLPFAMQFLAGERVPVNVDLTLLRGDGNIFVLPEEWLAPPFRTDSDRKQAAA
ncbi:MAG TPA: hypothetical protein VF778_04025, partial [Xanthobacteraceae bacterium]